MNQKQLLLQHAKSIISNKETKLDYGRELALAVLARTGLNMSSVYVCALLETLATEKSRDEVLELLNVYELQENV